MPQPPEPTGWLRADEHHARELEAIVRELVDDLATRLRVERDAAHVRMIALGLSSTTIDALLREADSMHRGQLIAAEAVIRRGIAEARR